MSRDREEAVKILRLVQKHRPDLIPADATIRLATDEEDRLRATDAVIQKADGTVIQVGYRRQRDKGARLFKIRYENEGYVTELAKIQSGYCNWYLCTWYNKRGISHIAIVNVDGMRDKGQFANNEIYGRFTWRYGRFDVFTSYVFRYLHWIRDEGNMIFEKTVPK